MLAPLAMFALSAALGVAAAPPPLKVGAPLALGGRRGRRALVDAHGRERLLRGVNIGVEWWHDDGRPIDAAAYENACPENGMAWTQPPVCGVDAGAGKWASDASALGQNDLAQIRAMGFNVVRLAVSWSQLEPAPGSHSQVYLDRIAQVVDWATEQDVWVFIDFHQDSYSYFASKDRNAANGNMDGAPAWATPPEPAYTDGSIVSELEAILWEEGTGSPIDRSFIAAQTFWENRAPTVTATAGSQDAAASSVERSVEGIQERFIIAMAFVAMRFKHNPTVLGYEIMNEPIPGIPKDLDFVGFSAQTLYPFYARVLQSLTGVRDGLPDCDASDPFPTRRGQSTKNACAVPDLGVHDDKIYLFEPMAARNQLDFSAQWQTHPWTSYPNIVYAPHTYTGSFTLNPRLCPLVPKGHCPPRPPFKQSLQTAWIEAEMMNASVIVTEFGCSEHLDKQLLAPIVEQQDRQRTSSTFWVWKQNGGSWGLWKGTESHQELYEAKRDILSRVLPVAVVGQLLSFRYASDNQTFAMRARAPAATVSQLTDPDGTNPPVNTLVYIPTHVSTPSDSVTVTGGCKISSIVTQPDGSRLLSVTVDAEAPPESEYTVQFGDTKSSLLGNLRADEKSLAQHDKIGIVMEIETMVKMVWQAVRFIGSSR